MDWLSDPQAWVGLATLTMLELVLGIDNIIFISILAAKLPAGQQARARSVGLAAALGSRLLLLLSITWIMRLTRPLFAVAGHPFSGRDLILIAGGLFLIAKAVVEIHGKLEGAAHPRAARDVATFGAVVAQILVVDVIFSLDSVITAVGMSDILGVMITATVVAVAVMLVAAGPISGFVDRHPTVKMLALAFLVMIGGNLFVEGFGIHVPKGYTYFAMAFAVLVEMLNLRLRAPGTPVRLRAEPPA